MFTGRRIWVVSNDRKDARARFNDTWDVRRARWNLLEHHHNCSIGFGGARRFVDSRLV